MGGFHRTTDMCFWQPIGEDGRTWGAWRLKEGEKQKYAGSCNGRYFCYVLDINV